MLPGLQLVLLPSGLVALLVLQLVLFPSGLVALVLQLVPLSSGLVVLLAAGHGLDPRHSCRCRSRRGIRPGWRLNRSTGALHLGGRCRPLTPSLRCTCSPVLGWDVYRVLSHPRGQVGGRGGGLLLLLRLEGRWEERTPRGQPLSLLCPLPTAPHLIEV